MGSRLARPKGWPVSEIHHFTSTPLEIGSQDIRHWVAVPSISPIIVDSQLLRPALKLQSREIFSARMGPQSEPR